MKNWIKNHVNFLTRVLCLIIVIAALFVYQNVAGGWAVEVEANEEAIAEVESYNAQILAAESVSSWADGSYSASACGFGGYIYLTVTIEDGVITDITIDSADGEDDSYFSAAIAVIDDIIAAQSADVDAITGATFSSTGIKDAVEEALSQAVSANE